MKKAIEIFKKHGAHYYENDESAIVEAMEEYANQSKWIDVSKSVPYFGVKVLILSIPQQPRMDGSLDYGIASRSDIKGTSLEKDKRTVELLENNHQFMRNETVLFWQPLPPPPTNP